MKKIIYSVLLLILFYGCGSTKTTWVNRDPAFNSEDFFNSSMTLYPPLSVSISNSKYADYTQDNVKAEITNMVKEKLEKTSIKANVILGKEKVPDYFRGILINKAAATQFIKETRTKYLVFIQQVLVGEETKMQSMFNQTTGLSSSYAQGVTKATIFFDIWETNSASSVFSIEVKSDINDGLLINSLNTSFEKAISEIINSIKK